MALNSLAPSLLHWMEAAREAAIMRLAMILGVVIVLAGCGGVPYSNPYASPDTSQRAECERAGGYWHSNPAVCESPMYRW